MNTLTVVRVNLAALPVAEQLDVTEQVRARLAGTPAVVLHTCERFEVYTSGGLSTSFAGRPAETCIETGAHAFRHLMRVASGLESRIPGEPHVLGQVRAAFASASQGGSLPLEVRRAFAAAIRCARFVRDRSALGAQEGGYAARAVATVTSMWPSMRGTHVVVVGSGAMAREVTLRLAETSVGRVTVAGRHAPAVDAIARAAGATGLRLEEFLAGTIRCDAVITAVSARLPLLTPALLRAIGASLLVDLGAMPNVGPDDAVAPPLRVLRLEDLGTGIHTEAFAVAEALVEREVARYASVRSSIPVRHDDWRARRAS